MRRFNTKDFTYEKQDREFVAEASDLGLPSLTFPQKFELESERTGKVVILELHDAVRVREELSEMVYMPAWGSNVRPFTVHIIND